MPFDVHRTAVRGHPVLEVEGELDLLTAPTLADAVQKALADRPALLVVDLTGTSFIDSSGARTVALSVRRAAEVGAATQVVCPRRNYAVRLVLDLLDLRALVPVLESTDEIGLDQRP